VFTVATKTTIRKWPEFMALGIGLGIIGLTGLWAADSVDQVEVKPTISTIGEYSIEQSSVFP